MPKPFPTAASRSHSVVYSITRTPLRPSSHSSPARAAACRSTCSRIWLRQWSISVGGTTTRVAGDRKMRWGACQGPAARGPGGWQGLAVRDWPQARWAGGPEHARVNTAGGKRRGTHRQNGRPAAPWCITTYLPAAPARELAGRARAQHASRAGASWRTCPGWQASLGRPAAARAPAPLMPPLARCCLPRCRFAHHAMRGPPPGPCHCCCRCSPGRQKSSCLGPRPRLRRSHTTPAVPRVRAAAAAPSRCRCPAAWDRCCPRRAGQHYWWLVAAGWAAVCLGQAPAPGPGTAC